MRNHLLVPVLTLANLVMSCSLEKQAELHTVPEEDRIPGRYVIAMVPEAKATQSALERIYGAGHVYQHVFPGFSTTLTPEALGEVRRTPGVAAVYEVGYRHMNAVQSDVTWGIDRLDQAYGNFDKRYRYGFTGKGVKVYVVDSGITVGHADFGGRAALGTDVTVDRGTRFENIDGNGHGTHVAGTIGSTTYGVAKEVTLVAVKVFDRLARSASDETVLAGIDWILNDHKANPAPAVINMSLGGKASPLSDESVRRAVEAGITTVVAAGNDNQDACRFSPAREPLAITVASMNRNDRKSIFSNWGRCIDMIAPGTRITSTWKSGGSHVLDGTSMAAPHVAGLAALVLSAHPQKTPGEVRQFLTENAIQSEAHGFSSDTPNHLAAVLWNVPQPADLWEDSFRGKIREGEARFPTRTGFSARTGNVITAEMRASGWFEFGNNDLFLVRLGADGSGTDVAASTGNGMRESFEFSVTEDGTYVIEVRPVTGGAFKLETKVR